MDIYPINAGDGRSTEELVEAGNYAWAHSQAVTANFPARQFGMGGVREIVLLAAGRQVSTEEMISEAAGMDLERPTYEDALYFGVQHPQVQLDGPVAFLHEPWEGFYGPPGLLLPLEQRRTAGVGIGRLRRPLVRRLSFRVPCAGLWPPG